MPSTSLSVAALRPMLADAASISDLVDVSEDATPEHYAALYALPGAMHSGFAQFAAFDQDAIDNRAFLAQGGRLKMPVFAIGGQKSFGPMMVVDALSSMMAGPSMRTPTPSPSRRQIAHGTKLLPSKLT